jgi:formyl-CoA transferase
MLLGDLGADIVKVEEPSCGDESRGYGPPFLGGESAYFLSVNRNKRSCAVDLKSPAGKEIVTRLAAVADVVVENFRPGTLDRLGLGYDTLSRGNDQLVLCSISGFGRTGADRERPGYDLIVQGESGLMDITGDADGPPTKVGTSIVDLVSGLYAAQGVLAALMRRAKTGRGGRVDVAMIDATVSLLTFNAGICFATGQSPKRRGNAHPTISPYETFEAADGWINIGVANDKFWFSFCDVVGCADLKRDPRFQSPAARVAHRQALKDMLAPILRAQARHSWMQRLGGAGIPCGEIKTVGEACSAAQLLARGVVRQHGHPAAGDIGYIASAIRFDDCRPADAVRPPLLGEHTAQVLVDWLGLSPAETAAYSAAGAFGSSRG